MDIAALQPDAGIEIKRIEFGDAPRVDQVGLREGNAGVDHQGGKAIAMRVQSRARAVDDAHILALPFREGLERRSALAHRENDPSVGAAAVCFVECQQVDGEFPLAQAMGNLVKEQDVVRLVASGRILLFPI